LSFSLARNFLPYDKRRPPIDHSVPYLPGFFVTRVIGNQDVPPDNTLDIFFRFQS
jgi:hypothetical protein